MYEVVTPAKAGVHQENPRQHQIPGFAFPSVTFAGMTVLFISSGQDNSALCRLGHLLDSAKKVGQKEVPPPLAG